MARYSNSVTLDDTGVVPGSYTSANIVVNSKGQIITASDGDGGGSGPSGSLDDLVDVNVSTAVNGQVLTFNGSIWQNADFNLDSLGDVALSTSHAGDILYYNGSTWVNGPASDNNLLDINSIGTVVQAHNSKLQDIADFAGTAGILAFNGTNVHRVTLQALTDGGLKIVNPDGAISPITLSFDFSNIDDNTALSIDDELLVYDVSADKPSKASITDIMIAGGAITNGQNLGSGADIFILAQDGVAQFRGILSNSPGVVIGTDPDDILVGLSASLESLSVLEPNNGNFIVGNGTQWTSKTTSEAKDALGFGTMAEEDADDYLAKIGGTMSGNINMAGYAITNVLAPTSAGDAANKQYVDSQIAAGVDAGAGLTKNGTVIDVVAADSSITVNPDSIQLNTTFTDNLYNTKLALASAILNSEGAKLIGTSTKASLGNAVTVEEALSFIDNYFANSLAKFTMDLSALWNLDVGVPNVNAEPIRDASTAIFVDSDDSAIYVDFMIPSNFDNSQPLTFSANFAKKTTAAGTARFGLSWQYQRPGVAPANYPSRGPAPNWAFTNNVGVNLSNSDTLLHTLTWTIPAFVFQPNDTVTLRLTRLASDVLDTYTDNVNLFTTIISQ